MIDNTEISAKQQNRIDGYLNTFGMCYLETIEGEKVKNVIVKEPKRIMVIVDPNKKLYYYGDDIIKALETQRKIKEKSICIILTKELKWFQKLLLKTAGLI